MKKKITTTELANYIAQREGTSKSSAEAFVRKFFEVIERGLMEDKYVKIKGLGTFKLVVVGERESVNVQTGERFQISGHTKVSFTPDSSLKELVNRPFAHFMAVDLNDETEAEELDAIDQRMAEEYKDLDNANNEDVNEDINEDVNDADTEEEEECPDEDMEDIPEAERDDVQEHHGATQEQVCEEPETKPSQSTDTEVAVGASVREPAATHENETEDTDGPEIHTDSPIISISTGEMHQTSTAPMTTSHPASSLHDAHTAQSEGTLNRQEAEDHPASHDEEKEDDKPYMQPEADDICVSDPHPINHHAEQTATHFSPTTTNSMGYAYSEVPSRKKHNWWKTATIAICAMLLMACCYYAGYFRLLCPTCELSPLFDSWNNNAQPSEPKAQSNSKPQPTKASLQKDATNGQGQQQVSITRNQDNASPLVPETVGKEQKASSTQDGGKAQGEFEKTVQTPPPAPQASAKANTASSNQAPVSTAQPQSTFHKVKAGENLTRIVRRHYGSESYVNMVIKRNHLKNANNVTVGMVLELPPKPQNSK